MPPSSLAICSSIFLLGIGVIYRLLQIGKRDPRMPPGPPTLPILGNLHQIPITGLNQKFREWAKQHGSIFTLKFGPSNVVILCDRKAIHELLDKKGNIYSDRPENSIIRMVQVQNNIVNLSMGPSWRLKRKVVSHNFSPKQLDEKHFQIQEAEATLLMNNLLDSPDAFFDHIRRFTASVASTLVYGQRASTIDSFWAHALYEIMEQRSQAFEPGANPPVDQFKFLMLVPTWWAFWKRRAIAAGDITVRTWDTARSLIDQRRARGDHRDCVADHLLDEYEKSGWPMSERDFNLLLGEILEAGADTTSAQLLTLILAFAKYPEVQKKARAKIDAVCGDRPPIWSDFKDLPYINAIMKEGMRWRPTAVSAAPHRLREDDEYEGMFIPKNTTIFLATWAIHHTESIFEDPDHFNPDRYMHHDKLANDYAGSSDWSSRDRLFPATLPNANLHECKANKDQALYITTDTVLDDGSALESILQSETGEVMPIDPNAYTEGVLHTPLPFKAQIKPRDNKHIVKIKEARDSALSVLEPYN